MVHLVILFIILILATQLESQDRLSASVFAIVFLEYELLSSSLSGFLYSALDAGLACLIAIWISRKHYTNISYKITIVCAIAVLLDFIGWVVWYGELSTRLVDWAFIILYTYTALITYRGSRYDGVHSDDRLLFIFHTPIPANCNSDIIVPKEENY